MRRFGVLILFTIVSCVFCLDKSKIIDTNEGKVEGYLSESGLYYEYLGIRYGIPQKFRVSIILRILLPQQQRS